MTKLLYAKYLNEDYLFHVNINSSILITNIHGEIGMYVKSIKCFQNCFRYSFVHMLAFNFIKH